MAYSFVVSLLIAFVIKRTIGLRVSGQVELAGMDIDQHAEAGYDLSHVGYSTRSISRTVMVPPAERSDEPAGTTARI